MAKILRLDELIGVADNMSDTANPKIDDIIQRIKDATTELAHVVANHYGINHGEASADEGIMVCFYPKTPEQPCPQPIHEADEQGDWEMK